MKMDYKFWISQLESAHQREKDWLELSQKYESRYRGEKLKNDFKRYNIFYSNTETLKSALLAQVPQVVIKSRFAKEQAQNEEEKKFYSIASEIIERAVSYNIADSSIEPEIEALKYDYLITGRGVLWCSFDADTDTVPANEKIIVQHIDFRDFRMSNGKKWKDVWWVARRHILSRSGLVKRFGAKGNDVELNRKNENYNTTDEQADVWEIWCRQDKKVYFVAEGYQGILEVKEDPYNLTGFFPTPEPLRSIRSNKDLTPIPEFSIYEREASDLAECSARISKLVGAIKARAMYPARFKDQIDSLNTSNDNEFVSVDVGSEINELGGIQGLFMYEPIEEKQRVAMGLYEQQKNLVQNIYEITGISDIMRNVGAPRETATATAAKGKFGSLRLEARQEQINYYVKEVYKIITELVCELYTVETLMDITAIKLPTQLEKINYKIFRRGDETFFNKPSWESIKRHIEDNRLRSFLLDIETNYTIFENDAETRAQRMELFNVFSKAVQEIMPVVSATPELAAVYAKLISFMIDGFKVSRNVKASIEEAFGAILQKIKAQSQMQRQQGENPAMVMAKAETLKAQAQLEKVLNDAKMSQMKLQIERAKAVNDMNYDQKEQNLKEAELINKNLKGGN